MDATVLIIDDVAANRDLLRQTLEPLGYEVLLVADGESGLLAAVRAQPDVVLLDLVMPGIDGFETCRRFKANEATRLIPILFITAQHETSSLVEALAIGGVDYITKPFQAEEVRARVETHLRINRLTKALGEKNLELTATISQLRAEIARREQAEQALAVADEQLSVISERETAKWGLAAFVGCSPAFQKMVQGIRRAQNFGPLTVLITGESGTGKELVARAIHYGGPQAKGPFIAINCPTIPTELAESALFGHMRGAFTGATESRKGCFEQANGGTLFLDEIGDMPLSLQAKLLRVLEDGMIAPVGSTESKKVSVRVLAATNAELDSAMEAGKFRRDLFYRLARLAIDAPPLRERREDILLLADHFVCAFAGDMGMARASLTAQARRVLMAYDYPGNVRELRNLIERALITSGGAKSALNIYNSLR